MGPSTFIVCMVCPACMDSPCITISNSLYFCQDPRSYLKCKLVSKYTPLVLVLSQKNYYYGKGRDGGGQKVMIEIIVSENDENDVPPLRTVQFSI